MDLTLRLTKIIISWFLWRVHPSPRKYTPLFCFERSSPLPVDVEIGQAVYRNSVSKQKDLTMLRSHLKNSLAKLIVFHLVAVSHIWKYSCSLELAHVPPRMQNIFWERYCLMLKHCICQHDSMWHVFNVFWCKMQNWVINFQSVLTCPKELIEWFYSLVNLSVYGRVTGLAAKLSADMCSFHFGTARGDCRTSKEKSAATGASWAPQKVWVWAQLRRGPVLPCGVRKDIWTIDGWT